MHACMHACGCSRLFKLSSQQLLRGCCALQSVPPPSPLVTVPPPLPVQARVLRRHMWWQNTRMAIIITALVLLAAYVLICIICSPTFNC